jgi:hypothetical protein
MPWGKEVNGMIRILLVEADRRMYEQKKGKKSAREGTRLILQ